MKQILFLVTLFFCSCNSESLDFDGKDAILKRSIISSIQNEIYTNVDNMADCYDKNCQSDLGTISNETSFFINDNTTPGYVDYELEEVFQCSNCFDNCQTKIMFNNQEFVTFILKDNGVYLDELEFEYLSNTISAEKFEEIKIHFSCIIEEYKQNTISGITNSQVYVEDINFICDALLCNDQPWDGCSFRSIVANVKYVWFE